MNGGTTRIAVLGDVARQTILWPVKDRRNRFDRHEHWMGAVLLRNMIDNMLEGTQPAHPVLPNYDAIFKELEKKGSDTCRQCDEFVAVLGSYPKKSGESSDRVMRIVQDLRTCHPVAAPAQSGSGHPPVANALHERLLQDFGNEWNAASDPQSRKIVVVYDRGMGFRERIGALAPLLSGFAATDVLVYAVDDELTPDEPARTDEAASESKLYRNLASALDAVRKVRDRAVLVVTAKALRRAGHDIVQFGSVEQAVHDVVSHVGQEPLRTLRGSCARLVVVFNETAVLCLHSDNDESAIVQGTIHVGPNFDRIVQVDPKRYGSMPAKVSIVVAALVRKLQVDSMALADIDLDPAFRLGVLAYSRLAEQGFKDDKTQARANESSFDCIEQALSKDTIAALKKDESDERRENMLASLRFKVDKFRCHERRVAQQTLLVAGGARPAAGHGPAGSVWDRLHALTEDLDEKGLRQLLHDIVLRGVDEALREPARDTPAKVTGTGDGAANATVEGGTTAQGAGADGATWFPAAVIRCPYAQFGKYRTIDDVEVAGYLDLAKLIYKYLNEKSWDKPLSIAVFGPPGSGKSFAVKEILKFASPAAAKKSPLEFNLAQFSSVDQLTEAFHRVQDRALADNEVPLVIFDEFDSVLPGGEPVPLGWLKYFLAPMQDGLFRGAGQDYRVGRAIFLFSGGVAPSFDDFRQVLAHKKAKQSQLKLPDFISRLRGHLTVSGINYVEERTTVLRVKRAMLLRSLLEIHARPILVPQYGRRDSLADIRPSVIDRFVDEWNYVHGLRSMEAVIQSSRWLSGLYADSSLPSNAQLQPHVYRWKPVGRT